MDQSVKVFLKVLDPNDNSTGGGTASAIAGAMASALVAMVARLSVGKEGMREESFYRQLADQAEILSRQLSDGGRQDSEAFGAIRSAFRLPKQTEGQKAKRREAIQKATILAARVPLENANRCLQVLELAEKLAGRSNSNAASDLECGYHLARAGLLGCVANVRINLPTIKDERLSAQLLAEASELLQRVPSEDFAAAG